MTIKSSGAWCDICENPILDGAVNIFGIKALEKKFHSCNKCFPFWNENKPLESWPNSKLKHKFIKVRDIANKYDTSFKESVKSEST